MRRESILRISSSRILALENGSIGKKLDATMAGIAVEGSPSDAVIAHKSSTAIDDKVCGLTLWTFIL